MHTLILRIGAIVILVSLLEKVPFSVETLSNTWENSQNINAIIFSIAPGIFALIVSFLLWFFPYTISSKLSTPTDNLKVESDYAKALGEILISIIGLYILANAIPDLIYHIVLYIVTSNENLEILPVDRAASIATIAELIIGLFLLYGSGLIHKFVQRLKKEINEKSL
jgi:hypothetical protein